MAKKDKLTTPRPQRQPYWQQQKNFSRLVISAGAVIVLAVAGVLGSGYYIEQYKPMHETVLEVNSRKFNMDYFIKALQFYGTGAVQNVGDYYNISSQVQQIITNNELIVQAAEKLNILISDTQVEAELDKQDVKSTPVNRDYVRATLLNQELLDKYFYKEVPETADQRQVLAMFLPGLTAVNDITTSLNNGGDFSALAEKATLESYTKEKKGNLDWVPQDLLKRILGATAADGIFNAEVGTLSNLHDAEASKNVGYWIVKLLERKDDNSQVHLNGILLGSPEEASAVKQRLENGEDFATVAKELSLEATTKENGGDFDWQNLADLPESLMNFGLNSTIGSLSEPLDDTSRTTKGGYWLFKVTASEINKAISDENRSILERYALSDWATGVTEDTSHVITNKIDDAHLIWAVNHMS